jgi:uncharacterized membrane protein
MTTVNDVFGPIGREYCLYFYILSIVGMIWFVMVLVGTIFYGMSKKLGFEFYVISLAYSFNFLFMYLQNRLLFNMCGNTL